MYNSSNATIMPKMGFEKWSGAKRITFSGKKSQNFCSFFHIFFRKMYGKISKNFDFFYLKMLFFWLQIIFEAPFLAWWFHLMSHANVTWEFLRFWNFCPFLGPQSWKNWQFLEKSQFFDLIRPKNGPKTQNLEKSQITFV